jgi:sRNA-binding protein
MNNDQILELLCERFPGTFARNPVERRSLKRGIDRDLVARLDGTVSRSALKRALGIHTACPEYRAKLIEGAPRLDLDGNPAGAVTAGEAEHALTIRPAKTKPTPSAPPAPPPKPKRMSLDDLRRAARLRRGLAWGGYVAARTWSAHASY